MRNRLFVRWFNEYNFQQSYVLRTAMIKDGKVENFAAIIVQRSHPRDKKIFLKTLKKRRLN